MRTSSGSFLERVNRKRTCRVEYSLDLSSEYDRVRILTAHEMERVGDADDSDNSDERFDRASRK